MKTIHPIRSVLKANSKASKQQFAKAELTNQTALVAKPSKKQIANGFDANRSEKLYYKGGRTIRNLGYANFYIGGKASWKITEIIKINWALAEAMNDKYLNHVIRQYFNNRPISTVFHASAILPGKKPSVFSEGNVKALVAELFAEGRFKGYDLPNTVFCFFLPQGTVLNTDKNAESKQIARKYQSIPFEDEDSSAHGLGGYHGSVHVDAKTTVYYAIAVYSCENEKGELNGITAFDEPWKNVVATFYHELCEARTDPDVDDAIRTKLSRYCGWVSKSGKECGDYPMSESGDDLSLVMQEIELANGKGKVPVQFQYSNAVGGPEGPIKKLHKLK